MFKARSAKTAYAADDDVEAYASTAGRFPQPQLGPGEDPLASLVRLVHENNYPHGEAADAEEAARFERELLAGLDIDLAQPAETYDPAYAGQPADEDLYDPYAAGGYEPWPDAAYPEIADGQAYVPDEADGYPVDYGMAEEAASAPPRGRRMALLGGVAVAALCLVAGVGYALKGDVLSGDPVVVHASADPVKVAPDASAAPAAAPESSVFAALDDGGKVEERIIPRDQAAAPLDGDEMGTGGGLAPLSPLDAGPRRVRTVVVRADGSMVDTPMPAPDAPAEMSSPVLDASALAPTPVAEAPADMALPGLPDDGEADVMSTAMAAPEVAPSAPAFAEADLAAPAPVAVSAVAPVPAEPAPAPAAAGPLSLEAAAAGAPASAPAPVETASIAPVAATPAAGAPAAPGSYVQVSSQRSEAGAMDTFASLQRRHPDIFAGATPNVQRADLGDRGVYYRLRVGPMASAGAASDFCSRLRSAGGDCLVVNN